MKGKKEEDQQSPFVQWSGFTDHLLDERLNCCFDGEDWMMVTWTLVMCG